MNVAHLDFPLLSISPLSDTNIHLSYYFTTSCLVSDAPSFGTGWSWHRCSEALLLFCAGCKLENKWLNERLPVFQRSTSTPLGVTVAYPHLLEHRKVPLSLGSHVPRHSHGNMVAVEYYEVAGGGRVSLVKKQACSFSLWPWGESKPQTAFPESFCYVACHAFFAAQFSRVLEVQCCKIRSIETPEQLCGSYQFSDAL